MRRKPNAECDRRCVLTSLLASGVVLVDCVNRASSLNLYKTASWI